MRAVATTGRKLGAGSERLARETAARLGIPFVPRGDASIRELRERHGADAVLVAKQGQLVLDTEAGELFFHPSMAHLRLKRLRFGNGKDAMLEAMGLQPGMSVLDCTLGLAADAIVASFAAGPEGHVTGLESSPLVAAVTGYGLAHCHGENYPIQEAMRRIEAIQGDYMDFLQKAPDRSYDVVYFDPMFRHPLLASCSMTPLRLAANHGPVPLAAVREARRVARRRVVLKENARSLEFSRLGFLHLAGGKYSKVRYGWVEASEN